MYSYLTVVIVVGLFATTISLPSVNERSHFRSKRQAETVQNVSSFVGTVTMLECHSPSISNADWSKDKSTSNKRNFELVVGDGVPQNGYLSRYSLKRTEDGWQNLIIKNTTVDDAGLYRCGKEGGIGGKTLVQLNVQEPPNLIQPKPSANCTRSDTTFMTVTSGTRVVLQCLNGSRRILWRYYDKSLRGKDVSVDGMVLRDFGGRFVSGDENEGNNSLVIVDVEPSDAGRYECVDDSGRGQTQNVALFVTGTSGLSVTDGLLIAVIIMTAFSCVPNYVVNIIRVVGKLKPSCMKRNAKNKCGGQHELEPLDRQDTRTDDDNEDNPIEGRAPRKKKKRRVKPGDVAGTMRTTSSYTLEQLQTIAESNSKFCYFSELNGIYCMVDRSGNFTTYKYNPNENGYCRFDKLYHVQSAETYVPSGFTASRMNNCFYVGNRFKRCVYRVLPEVEKKDVKIEGFIPSLEKANEYPKSVSAMPDGRVAVLVAIEQPFSGKWHGRLQIHRPDGTLQTTIRLPQQKFYPWCVVYTENDTYAITYGMPESKVIRMDSECRTVAESKEELSMLRGIKYDKTNNSLYVIEVGECKILQMNLQLDVLCVVYDWRSPVGAEISEDIQPIRITLNADETHMIVGFESGRVTFYSFTRPQISRRDDQHC